MEEGAKDLLMVQLMPPPSLASLKSRMVLVPADPGCHGKKDVKQVFCVSHVASSICAFYLYVKSMLTFNPMSSKLRSSSLIALWF